jgi:hypothetical protein
MMSYVSAPALSIPSDFTLEIWLYPMTFSNEQLVVAKQVAAVVGNQFRLGIFSGSVYFMMTDAAANGQDLWSLSSGYRLAKAINPGMWTHAAVTKMGATFQLVIDGVLQTTYTTTTALTNTSPAPFQMGAGIAAGGAAPEKVFDGIMDEVRLWDIARTPAEILADMGKTIPPTHPQWSHLVAYYKFDDGSGPSATDSAGTNPGSLVNSPQWIVSTAPTGK